MWAEVKLGNKIGEKNVMKVIPVEQRGKRRCYFCGETRSVKYIVTVNNPKPSEVPCCNKCALMREILNKK